MYIYIYEKSAGLVGVSSEGVLGCLVCNVIFACMFNAEAEKCLLDRFLLRLETPPPSAVLG